MKKIICLLIIMSFAGFAMAHWNVGDVHKMGGNGPQLPDPTGYDVCLINNTLADDWQCGETGPVDQIHFWISWKGITSSEFLDQYNIIGMNIEIWSDDPVGDTGIQGEDPVNTWSKPFEHLWESNGIPEVTWVELIWEVGVQGWYDPFYKFEPLPLVPPLVIENDHCNCEQVNVTIPTIPTGLAFEQVVGTTYWLVLTSVTVTDPTVPVGWKTSTNHWNDDAVFLDPVQDIWVPLNQHPYCDPPPILRDPYNAHMDLAFVISGSGATLPVELSLFTAQYLNNVPTLYWVTQSEIDNIGWNVYCNTENDFTTANKISNLIAGHGTTSEPHSYIYEDNMLETIPGNEYWYWIESVDLGGEVNHFNSVNIVIPDSPGNPSPTKPVIYALQNSPNPFSSSTEIKFTLSESALAEVTIYNIIGEKVKTLPLVLASEDTEASAYWDGKDESGEKVAHGIYFYTLKAGKSTYSGKMIHIR